MKKDLIFAPVMVVIAVLLFLLKHTKMTAHIIISVLGIAVLLAYTILTKKEWKLPPLEIIMRACYGIALITGVVMYILHGNDVLSVVHKVTATLFTLTLVASFVHKVIVNKKVKA